MALDSHVRLGENAAALLRRIEVLNQWRGSSADGADDGRAGEHSPIVQFYSFMSCRDGARLQYKGDAGLLHSLPGEFRQSGGDFGQDVVLGMNQRDHHVVLAKVMVKARAAANQFVDFSRDFNATEARSHDNEAEMPALALRIAGGLGMFHLTDNVLAQVYGIAHNLEGEGMLGHPRDDAQVAFSAAGNYHVIVVQAVEHAAAVLKSYL